MNFHILSLILLVLNPAFIYTKDTFSEFHRISKILCTALTSTYQTFHTKKIKDQRPFLSIITKPLLNISAICSTIWILNIFMKMRGTVKQRRMCSFMDKVMSLSTESHKHFQIDVFGFSSQGFSRPTVPEWSSQRQDFIWAAPLPPLLLSSLPLSLSLPCFQAGPLVFSPLFF